MIAYLWNAYAHFIADAQVGLVLGAIMYGVWEGLTS